MLSDVFFGAVAFEPAEDFFAGAFVAATAVDLRRLQDVLRRGVSRFDASQIETRRPDVLARIRRIIAAWVQRYKQLKIERRTYGVHIEIESRTTAGTTGTSSTSCGS